MRIFILFFIFYLICFRSLAAEIKGKVYDSKSEELLISANVYLKNTDYHVLTDADGEFELKKIPEGTYTLVVSYTGYITQERTITVSKNQKLTINFNLLSSNQTTEEVTVIGKINREQEVSSRLAEKKADNVINVISAQAIAKLPDINVANVLQRMSGVTLQRDNTGSDGSFAIIRGMDPRYSNTLINGIKIPSPDEKGKSVPLNIIPSDLVQKIEVSKTLTPEMEADAIAGTVNMVFKDAPDTTVLTASGSVGYSQIFFDRKYQWFDQSQIQQRSLNEAKPNRTITTQEDFSRSNLDVIGKQAPPSLTGSLTYGKRFFNNKLGLMVALSEQSQYSGANGQITFVTNGPNGSIPTSQSAPRRYSIHQINNGATFHLDYEVNKRNKISLTNFFLLSNFSGARYALDSSHYQQTIPGTGQMNPSLRTRTVTQIIENIKIEGNHQLSNGLRLDWLADASDAFKRAPDDAQLNTDFRIYEDPLGSGIVKRTATFLDVTDRIWQHNNDNNYEAQLNLKGDTKLFGNNFEIKTGILGRAKKRYNVQDYFTLDDTIGTKETYTGIYNVVWDVNRQSGTLNLDANNYTAHEYIVSGYLQGRIELGKLTALFGARLENTNQDFKTAVPYSQVNGGVLTGEKINYYDILPSLNLTYRFPKEQNLRIAYYKGISRPNYYELVPALIEGTQYNTLGNPYLKHSVADNFDIRYEYYPTPEDYFTLGAFYKYIQNPIEKAFVDNNYNQLTEIDSNFSNALNFGFEAVATKYIGNFGISANYTFTHSELKSSGLFNDFINKTTTPKTKVRSLQGSSPHVLNISLLYRDIRRGINAAIAYQYQSETLAEINVNFGGDYYLRPQSTLAFAADKTIGKHFIIYTKLNNLLNTIDILKVKDGNFDVRRDEFKQSYIVGVHYKL